MSSTKIKKLTRQLPFTATWLTNVLTVTTVGNHNLVDGDKVTLGGKDYPQELRDVAVTVTAPTVFTVASPANLTAGQVTISTFRAADIGRYFVTAPRSTGAPMVVQSFVIGTGAASYQIEGSLDKVHVSSIGSAITHTATTNDTKNASVADNWAHVAFNITAIGASTVLQILYSA